MRLFKNRLEAANELAQHLAFLKDEKPIVLGLANGGVPLADVIARQLDAPLDVLLIEKLFAPGLPNQVVGAVDEHGRISLIQSTARWHHVNSQQLVEPAREAFRNLQRHQSKVRAVLPELDVRGRTVVIVGQGVGTGAKMLGAIASVKDRGASKVVAAAPAGTSQASWQLHDSAHVVVIPHRPAKFKGIEAFYEDFSDVTDDHVAMIVTKWVADRPDAPQSVRTIPIKVLGTRGTPLMCELDLPAGCTRGSGPYPAVIFAHGFESSARSERNLVISRRLAKRDIIGVRMDFTGHGRSEGSTDDATDPRMLHDLQCVHHAVNQITEVDPARVGLVGSGTGAMIALHYAAQVQAIKTLVIRGPVCGRETIAARHVTAPALVIHAEGDTALVDAVQTLDRELGGPHQLLCIPNANRMFNDPISLELMTNATVDWLVDHLMITHVTEATLRTATTNTAPVSTG